MPGPQEREPRPHEAWLDEHGRVFTDLACVHCGYNLRMLSGQGVCPECGRPVLDSTRGDYLRYAPPEWVCAVAAGPALLLRAIVIWVGLLALLAALLFGWLEREVLWALALPGHFVVLSIAGRGLQLLTRRDPRPRQLAEGWSARRLLRGAAVLTLLLLILGLETVLLRPGVRLLEWAWAGVFVMFAIVLPALLLRHLRALLRRVPAHEPASAADGLFWAVLFFGIPSAAASVVFILFFRMGAGVVFCFTLFWGAYLALSFAFFLPDARRALRQAAEEAEANARKTAAPDKIIPEPAVPSLTRSVDREP